MTNKINKPNILSLEGDTYHKKEQRNIHAECFMHDFTGFRSSWEIVTLRLFVIFKLHSDI